MKNIIRFVICLCLLSLSACAVAPHNRIEIDARAYIGEVDSYLIVAQDEIYAAIDPSMTAVAAGGGLLFALIDSAVDNSRTKKAEELIVPIRDSLIDFDYGELLLEDVREKFKELEWGSFESVELERSAGDGHILEKIERSNATAVLVMMADYAITPNFNGVRTSVSLMMFPNREELYQFKERLDNNESPDDHSDNIYRNNLVINTPLNLEGKKEENAVKLAENDSSAVRSALEENAMRTAAEIVRDIQLVD